MTAIRTVLCPVDFTAASAREVRAGVEVCRRFGARLLVEHNFDPRPPDYLAVTWMWSEEQEVALREKEKAADAQLRALLAQVPPEVPVEGRLTRGPVDLALLVLARELPADLLVMVSHGAASGGHPSVTERIIVQCPCPVLTLPEEGPVDLRLGNGVELPVVVPVDFSEHSLAAVAYATELAASLNVRLRLLHVEGHHWSAADRRQEAEERLRALIPENLAESASATVLGGKPVESILEFAAAAHAGLILMGTHRKGAVEKLLTGATACAVLHRSRWPVWFVPGARGAEAWTAATTAEG